MPLLPSTADIVVLLIAVAQGLFSLSVLVLVMVPAFFNYGSAAANPIGLHLSLCSRSSGS